jgi:hypothetical protein
MKGKREFPPDVKGSGDVLSHLSKFQLLIHNTIEMYMARDFVILPLWLWQLMNSEWYSLKKFPFSESTCQCAVIALARFQVITTIVNIQTETLMALCSWRFNICGKWADDPSLRQQSTHKINFEKLTALYMFCLAFSPVFKEITKFCFSHVSGISTDLQYGGKSVHVSLIPNPSHLEVRLWCWSVSLCYYWLNCVVLNFTKAYMYIKGYVPCTGNIKGYVLFISDYRSKTD